MNEDVLFYQLTNSLLYIPGQFWIIQMTYKGFLKSMLETYEKVIREELCISRQIFMPMVAKKQFRMKYFLGEGIVV